MAVSMWLATAEKDGRSVNSRESKALDARRVTSDAISGAMPRTRGRGLSVMQGAARSQMSAGAIACERVSVTSQDCSEYPLLQVGVAR